MKTVLLFGSDELPVLEPELELVLELELEPELELELEELPLEPEPELEPPAFLSSTGSCSIKFLAYSVVFFTFFTGLGATVYQGIKLSI